MNRMTFDSALYSVYMHKKFIHRCTGTCTCDIICKIFSTLGPVRGRIGRNLSNGRWPPLPRVSEMDGMISVKDFKELPEILYRSTVVSIVLSVITWSFLPLDNCKSPNGPKSVIHVYHNVLKYILNGKYLKWEGGAVSFKPAHKCVHSSSIQLLARYWSMTNEHLNPVPLLTILWMHFYI